MDKIQSIFPFVWNTRAIKVAVNKEDLGDGQVQIQQMVFRTLKRGGKENEWIAELVLQTR
ncbi:hypothetical protein ABS315_25820 [Peribacillus frigoritolerans]|uniref:hypothetical protein n=1 Tax=Peribacillus TaxID=2675229 RepID=UPI0007BF8D20|nr:hypothetical protein [Peribacillus frigoritolerans]QNK49728.1 hypothetical protein H7F28_05455 [Brevibacterium sp. PAMC23299]TWD92562.1 hypothetical protein FB545_5272 [Peribacillus frigoritolerans]WHX67179.1 hypothetical protein QNH26_00330 [Peribacillus frigoritolerans]